MNMQPFERFVNGLRHAYGQRSLSDEIMDYLYDKCGDIPESACDWITSRFLRDYERLPAILHNSILRVYYDWQREHDPEHISGTCKHGCCHGGIITVQRFSEERRAHERMAFGCADCNRVKYPQMRRIRDLLAEGWEITTSENAHKCVLPNAAENATKYAALARASARREEFFASVARDAARGKVPRERTG